MSAGINQSHKPPLSPCRDPAYTQACFSCPSSHSNIYGPYLIDKANWIQSTALDTSKNSKIYAMCHQSDGLHLYCSKFSQCLTVNSALCVCVCVSKLNPTTAAHTLADTQLMIMSQQLARGPQRCRRCVRFHSSHP